VWDVRIPTTQDPCEKFRGTSLFVLVSDGNVLFNNDLEEIEGDISKQLD
jgi:hypothetical protein